MPRRRANPHRAIAAVAAVLVGAGLAGPAGAQLGFPNALNRPTEPFTWIWGRIDERDLGRRPDISVVGFDAGFRCELGAELSPASRLSTFEIRQIETDLRSASFFIETAAYMMYNLEQQRHIDWARLDCMEPEASEASEEELRELEEKALERAERRRERRRAREDD